MKTKTFNDYEEACIFCDEVDGQIQWCSYKGNQYWTVWFSTNDHRSRQERERMTYRELLYKATRLINHNQITLGEYEEMTKQLDREVEQEPCEDAVSRQAVLDILKDTWNMFSDANDAMQESIDTIEALPPVTPQEPKWIHVKDRLPIMGEDVLICDYDGDMYISYLHTDGKWGYDDGGNKLKNIIAWMPLPEPYEPQESENKDA